MTTKKTPEASEETGAFSAKNLEKTTIEYEKRLKHDAEFPHRMKKTGEIPIVFPASIDIKKAEEICTRLCVKPRNQYTVMNCGRTDCPHQQIDPDYFTLDDHDIPPYPLER